MLKPTFSINQYDKEGDAWDKCVLIHLHTTDTGHSPIVLRFNDVQELDGFVEKLASCSKEIKEAEGA